MFKKIPQPLLERADAVRLAGFDSRSIFEAGLVESRISQRAWWSSLACRSQILAFFMSGPRALTKPLMLSALLLIPLLAASESDQAKDITGLFLKLLSTRDALLAVVVYGIFTALYTAAIRFFFDRRLRASEQEHAEKLKRLEDDLSRNTQSELQNLQARLTETQTKNRARLDYEYEARKRLYSEIEPLLFILYAACEECYHRVKSLTRTSRQGCLGSEEHNWLGGKDYYLYSSAYKLVLPAVIYYLIERRLTFVDLQLDSVIRLRYLIAKNLVHSFTDDYDFAGLEPSIDYSPSHDESLTLSTTARASRRWQGIVAGHLENICEEMTVGEGKDRRAISFGEFEKHLNETTETGALAVLVELYLGFSPGSDPVLARMLLAQAELCHLFMSTFKQEITAQDLRPVLDKFCLSEQAEKDFSWGIASSDHATIQTVKPYVVECLEWIETAP